MQTLSHLQPRITNTRIGARSAPWARAGCRNCRIDRPWRTQSRNVGTAEDISVRQETLITRRPDLADRPLLDQTRLVAPTLEMLICHKLSLHGDAVIQACQRKIAIVSSIHRSRPTALAGGRAAVDFAKIARPQCRHSELEYPGDEAIRKEACGFGRIAHDCVVIDVSSHSQQSASCHERRASPRRRGRPRHRPRRQPHSQSHRCPGCRAVPLAGLPGRCTRTETARPPPCNIHA